MNLQQLPDQEKWKDDKLLEQLWWVSEWRKLVADIGKNQTERWQQEETWVWQLTLGQNVKVGAVNSAENWQLLTVSSCIDITFNSESLRTQ